MHSDSHRGKKWLNLEERKHTYSHTKHMKAVIQMTAMQALLKAVLWCLCVSEWTITSHSLCSNARHDSRTPLNPVKPLDPRTPGIESYCADRHINRPGNSRWLAAVRMGNYGGILHPQSFLLPAQSSEGLVHYEELHSKADKAEVRSSREYATYC